MQLMKLNAIATLREAKRYIVSPGDAILEFTMTRFTLAAIAPSYLILPTVEFTMVTLQLTTFRPVSCTKLILQFEKK
jgi:hypothetical protein